MTKSDMIKALAEETGLPQTQVTKVFNAIFDPENGIIALGVKSGDEVNIAGFGKFNAPMRDAREGWNPYTREAMTLPAGRQVKFKAGTTLKEFVKG